METVRDFIPFEGTDRDAEHSTDRGTSRAGQPGIDAVAEALAILREVGLTAVEDAALLGFQAASDFAGTVEELSRSMEYLQVVAAGAVDRTRKQAAAASSKAGTSWTTGWRDDHRPRHFHSGQDWDCRTGQRGDGRGGSCGRPGCGRGRPGGCCCG